MHKGWEDVTIMHEFTCAKCKQTHFWYEGLPSSCLLCIWKSDWLFKSALERMLTGNDLRVRINTAPYKVREESGATFKIKKIPTSQEPFLPTVINDGLYINNPWEAIQYTGATPQYHWVTND